MDKYCVKVVTILFSSTYNVFTTEFTLQLHITLKNILYKLVALQCNYTSIRPETNIDVAILAAQTHPWN